MVLSKRAAADRRNMAWTAVWLGAAGVPLGLWVAPRDAVQGDAQRLMYVHVPAAWTAYLAFVAVLLASVAYLIWADPRWDRAARAAGEIGVAATIVTLISGSVWGRLVWGVWWAWDPRLVATAAMLLIYLGQLTVRWTGTTTARGQRRAAVVGVAGFVIVPTVHFSVIWWRSLHQQATVLAPDPTPPINGVMLTALLLCAGAVSVTAAWLFLCRLAALESRVGPPSDDHPEAAPVATGLVSSGRA
ncbi:cytochrome c biogenesis protein CcsA [Luedemannella flava]|uniref:Heme exporter protein C n=1 Tax=Luedemannella flava TaxID=349316 RepID=A0ABN2LW42_9ACTN